MTEQRTREAAQPGDAGGLGADQPTGAPARATPPERRPSEDATADIEERQGGAGAKDRETGRAPSDAPSY